VPDLFAAKPLVITGRYPVAGSGTVRLRGKMAGRDFTREIRVSLPARAEHEAIETLWARQRVGDLMLGKGSEAEITKLGLEYRLSTPYTSFVAVEEKVVTEGGQPRRVEVPVEMPEGMSYRGVFGSMAETVQVEAAASMLQPRGVMGGIMPQARAAAPAPPPPPPQQRVDAAIAAIIARVKSGARPSVGEARFVFGGEARVRIVVSDWAAVEELKKAGLKVTRLAGTTVEGTAPVEKLEALTKVAGVVRVDPR